MVDCNTLEGIEIRFAVIIASITVVSLDLSSIGVVIVVINKSSFGAEIYEAESSLDVLPVLIAGRPGCS